MDTTGIDPQVAPQYTPKAYGFNAGSAASNVGGTPDNPTFGGQTAGDYFHDLGSPVHSGRTGKFNAIGNAYGINLAGYNQDITSAQDIWKGKGNSQDYGDVVGAAVGAFFGEGDPRATDAGRKIGRFAFPAVTKLIKSIF